MLKLRLKRCGRKRLPSYRLVVVPVTSRRDGKAIRELGFYNPITKELKLDTDKITFYLNSGVQPTETVRNLLVRSNIIKNS